MSVPPGPGQPAPGYPQPDQPQSGHPQSDQAQPGYPQFDQPQPGYPQPGQPQSGPVDGPVPVAGGYGDPAQLAVAPGPGVVVPFAAPPTDRDRKRLWISLGIGGALAVLCVIGCVIGFVVLARSAQVSPQDATRVVTSYLDALRDRDYATAYDALCTQQQEKQSEQQFRRSQSGTEISSYEVGTATATKSSTEFSVPATVRFASGQLRDYTFRVLMEGPGDLRICGIR
jgi:hypothetical protein